MPEGIAPVLSYSALKISRLAVGLPATYPRYANGRPARHDVCQPVGSAVDDSGLRGVYSRSAVTDDGSGRELAWFPARESSRASLVGVRNFKDWWYARGSG